MEITSKSKLLDVLEAYPSLEAQIINIPPPFQNLKNPVLGRTVGRLATLEMVAQIGGMDADRLVNTLRRSVGQAELDSGSPSQLLPAIPAPGEDDPPWIAGEPQFIVNGVELLHRGEVPLARVNELLSQLDSGRTILLYTNFEPTPIHEAMHKQGRQVFTRVHPADASQFLTFIQ